MIVVRNFMWLILAGALVAAVVLSHSDGRVPAWFAQAEQTALQST